MDDTVRDNSGYPVTIDHSHAQRYSVIGPLENGDYGAWDHEEGEYIGRGTRDQMNEKIAAYEVHDAEADWEDFERGL